MIKDFLVSASDARVQAPLLPSLLAWIGFTGVNENGPGCQGKKQRPKVENREGRALWGFSILCPCSSVQISRLCPLQAVDPRAWCWFSPQF